MKRKVIDVCFVNPGADFDVGKREFIHYLDTASVCKNRIETIQCLRRGYPSRAQRTIREKDILISSVRPNLEHNCFVRSVCENMVASTGFIHVRVNDCNSVVPEFLYYYLTCPQRVAAYSKIAETSQSSYPSFNKDVIEDVCLPTYDFSIQKRIGKFLSSVDRLIELSRKRIENLERLAKEIYDYWFVQFDFPDKNGKPYKTSGGKMVYNAELKREIPVGWEVRQLSKVADVFNGATPSTKIVDNYDGDIVWVTPKDLSDQQSKFTFVSERRITSRGYDSCSTRLLPVGTILMSSRAPIGLLSISKVELCTNQGFKSIVPKVCADLPYLYYYLKTYMKQIEMLGSGTTFKEVSRESMSSFCLAYVTDRSLYSKWARALMPIFETQAEAQKGIDELTQLREFLLPLLMNGQAKMR